MKRPIPHKFYTGYNDPLWPYLVEFGGIILLAAGGIGLLIAVLFWMQERDDRLFTEQFMPACSQSGRNEGECRIMLMDRLAAQHNANAQAAALGAIAGAAGVAAGSRR